VSGGIFVSLTQLKSKIETQRRSVYGPATRSVELFYLDQIYYGAVSPETIQAVIDEEKTMAAEDIARTKSRYAVVPRDYFIKDDSIADIYGNDLKQVFVDGAEWADQAAAGGQPGAAWEAERRWSEVSNIEKFMAAPAGVMMIEISAPPDKPAAELKAQGYAGMTHVRVSAKLNESRVKQYNIILPACGDRFLKDLQSLMGAQDSAELLDEQELLANPLWHEVGPDVKTKMSDIENLCGAALLNTNPDQAVMRMIKKAAGAKRQAWEFVDSAQHDDLNHELAAKIGNLSKQDPNVWMSGIEQIRVGYMKELRERYDGKARLAQHGSIIDAAASQAVADSDVFIVCGGTMEVVKGSVAKADTPAQQALKLLNEVKESGKCRACGAVGTLYGCGVFCSACNAIWCNEYSKSGEQLSESQIRYLRFGKQRGFIDELIDSFRQWNQQYEQEKALKKNQALAKSA